MESFMLEWLAYPLAGWWFLLSPSFRRRTRERWANESGLRVMQDVVGGVAGILISVLLPLFVWWQFAAPG